MVKIMNGVDLLNVDHTTLATNPTRRVSIVCSEISRFDAISECALSCLNATTNKSLHGGVETRLFCLESNIADSRIHVVASAAQLITDDFFQQSDVIIHHFGIISELHQVLAAAPRSAYVLVQFYGVTPPQYASLHMQSTISDSFLQISLFEYADEIIVNSTYLQDELRRIGISRPITRMDLFGANVLPDVKGARRHSKNDVSIVYCGRFVESKQIRELLHALMECSAHTAKFSLTLIGVTNYSDGLYLDEVKSLASICGFEVDFKLNMRSDEVAKAITEASLLVLPSLHEGFGMPVAEALAAGTPVVCSNAGSLPEVAGGLALLFETGRASCLVDALQNAIRSLCEGNVLTESGVYSYDQWATKAIAFSQKYRRESFVERWELKLTEIMPSVRSNIVPSFSKVNAVTCLYGSTVQHSPTEAQLVGRIIAFKLLLRSPDDVSGRLHILHRWATGNTASEEDLAAWTARFGGTADLLGLVNQIASLSEVRGSSFRLRSLAGIKAALFESSRDHIGSADTLDIPRLPKMTRAEVESILYASRTSTEFVKQAYRLVLEREADPGGLEHHTLLAANRDDWSKCLDGFYNSAEYASLISR